MTGDSGTLPQGEVPASAGQDQVPGPTGADHDPVPQRHPVGDKVHVRERAGLFSVCFVSWFGFEDGGILEEREKISFVTHLLDSVVPRKDALRINLT